MQHARTGPLHGTVAGFFHQFTLCAGQAVFARIELACRKFDHDPTHRVAKLALKHHAPFGGRIAQKGHHHHCARMHQIFTTAKAAIRQAHRIPKCL